MNFNRTFIFTMIFLYLLIIVLGLPIPLLYNAAKYAQIGREILLNNDWINLTILNEAYDQKPPLLFWLSAFSFKLFGVSTYSHKIPFILISLVGIFSTFKLGQLLYNKNTGILAAIFWATCYGYVRYHNDIRTDTLLTSMVIFSVWMLALFFCNKKWYYFLFGMIGIGLAMLTKGPVGLAIPVFAIGTNLIYNKKYNEIFHPRWLIGAIVIFIVITPALIGLFNQFGMNGLKFYFWTNNMGRITGSIMHNKINDPTFYIHKSLKVLTPWTLLAFTGIILEIITIIKKNTKKPYEMINLGAILLYLSVLSVAKAKTIHYMLSAVPFIFILTAKWSLDIYNNINFLKIKKLLSALNRISSIVMILFGLLFPIYIFPENKLIFWITESILFICCCYFLLAKSNLINQLLMLGFASAFFMLTLNVNKKPNMMHFQTSIIASKDFNNFASPNSTINIYKRISHNYELFLYSKNPGKYIITQERLQDFLPRKGAWFYTNEEGYLEMKKMNLNMTVMKSYHKPTSKKLINLLNPKTRKLYYEKMYLIKLE